jgi:hypothetical protein
LAKSREELLSEETRAAADCSSRFLQWGVTLMVSLQTALYFVRRDAANTLIEAGQLGKGSEVPLARYFLGTGFLIFVAVVLSMFTARANAQYRNYKNQLIQCRQQGVGITDLTIRYTGRWAYGLYAAFPIIDILARMWIHFSVRLSVHFH